MTVLEPETMTEVPADAQTLGEVMFRGKHRDEGLPEESGRNRPGLRRRLVPHRGSRGAGAGPLREDQGPQQGCIISGGENISSLEVEDALYRHPA